MFPVGLKERPIIRSYPCRPRKVGIPSDFDERLKRLIPMFVHVRSSLHAVGQSHASRDCLSFLDGGARLSKNSKSLRDRVTFTAGDHGGIPRLAGLHNVPRSVGDTDF